MISLHRAGDRHPGGDPAAGIETRHAFSFGSHYDPDNLRFGALIACNEERLAPGAGFDEHPHSHTEIITWVVEGELTHRDSTGHATAVRPGDLQHLSAAAGVRHVERNDGETPLTFLQMWLTPLTPGGEPSYGVVRGPGPGAGVADVEPGPGAGSGTGVDTDGGAGHGAGAASVSYAVPAAGAVLHVHRPGAGERVALPDAPFVYVHLVRGRLALPSPPTGPAGLTAGPSGEEIGPGDAVRIAGEKGLELAAATAGEVLVWEMAG